MVLKVAAIALTILAGCDYVVCGGEYMHDVLQVLAAIEHSFV